MLVLMKSEARSESGEPLAREERMNESPAKSAVKEKEHADPAKTKIVIINEPEAKLLTAVGTKTKTEVLAGIASTTRQEGPSYKIQIIAIGKCDPKQPRYAKLKNIARLGSVFLTKRNLYRVLLAAFIVEYRNGNRVGKVEEQR
ncbi:MAG: hypothetical protein EPO28_04825 [Saprospiraceae bacterium]|nr:MAG: hypothetical protein EPO28_04825 [Saprospiraceae bacterium]